MRYQRLGRRPRLIPKLKIAAILKRPIGAAVVKQIEAPVTIAVSVMAVIDVRVEVVVLEHHRQPAGIKLRVRLERLQAAELADLGDYRGILQRVGDLAQYIGVVAE